MESSRGGMLSTLIMTIPLIVVPAIALLRPPAPGGTAVTGSVEAGTESDDLDLEGFENELNGEFGTSADDSAEETNSAAKKGRSRDRDDEWSELFPEDSPRDSKKNEGTAKRSNSRSSGMKELEQAFGEEFSGGQETTGFTPEFSPDDTETAGASRSAEGAAVTASNAGSAPPAFNPGTVDVPSPASKPPVTEDTREADVLISELNSLGVSKCIWFTTGNADLHGFAAFLKLEDPEFLVRFEAIGNSRAAAVRDVLGQVRNWKNTGTPSGPGSN